MGKVENDIKQGLEQIAKKFGPSVLLMGKVLSINEDDHTIAVELQNDVVIDDVRLKSVIKGGNYKVVFPSESSNVLIGKIDDTEEWVLVAYESVEAFKIKIGTREFNFTGSGLGLKNGSENLKSVLQDLIQAIQNITVICAAAGSPSSVPANVVALTTISNRLNSLLQ